ncbi:MAG TPA: acyl-CoA dehydrogenase family protein [Terracidiphilus sp.]|nr:acyl-CoA dehydrogenase family protein [Terracidiphilus sp.]
MDFRWWDEAHTTLWRIAGRAELLEVRDKARQTARETMAPLLAQVRTGCGWTEEKARVLSVLDADGLTGIFASAQHGLTLPLALSVWELASVDSGVATCSLSGSLAQMPIRDFGTGPQRDRYLGRTGLRHGALCVTEPLPGAGTDAISLSGRMCLAGTNGDGEPLIEINKRGRFISHMDFAEFVVAAVQGDGIGVRGSALVILEPGDAGEFDRGAPVRKLGHHFASTTDPVFRLTVPASRIVGGYAMEEGAIVPRFSHRVLLEPALRRMRALLALMTAAKALSTVQEWFASKEQRCRDAESHLSLADLWATGEAAASLGFSAARLCDELDRAENPHGGEAGLAALYSPAAKLFSSNRVPESLRQAGLCGAPAGFDVRAILADAQVEEMYMGPSALQRRLVSVAMTGVRFLAEFQEWTGEMDAFAERLPRAGLHSLVEGMRLWQWTLEQLRQQADARGARLYCDARQGVTFAMADALCGLLAARSLALDVLEMSRFSPGRECGSIFVDLSIIAAGRAAAHTAQTCAELLCGYAERFPVSCAERRAFAELRTKLYISLRGTMDARERIAEFLCAQGRSSNSTV